MRVALTFGLFGMLRQSNLVPPKAALFDRSRHTCHGDIIQAPPGLLIIIRWAKTQQTVASSPVLPLPAIPGHPADPAAAFHQLISVSPSTSPDHPLLSYRRGPRVVVVTVPMLAAAFAAMIGALHLDPALYSLHSLRRGGATAAHRRGLHQELIKRHRMWSSDSFWAYITSLGVAWTVAADLAAAVRGVSLSQ